MDDKKLVEEMAMEGRCSVDNCVVGNMLNEGWTQAMTAALRVARKAITEERDGEVENTLHAMLLERQWSVVCDFVDELRARLAPEPSAPTEQEKIRSAVIERIKMLRGRDDYSSEAIADEIMPHVLAALAERRET